MSNDFTDSPQVKVVHDFSDLVQTQFHSLNNALCWQRKLIGDFQEIVSKLKLRENVTEVTIEDLNKLELSEAGNSARNIIVNDMVLLKEFGASPALNLIKSYERDNDLDFISTDVYSYHVDRSPIATDTFLCTYYGSASDIIPNDQVEQKILIPEIREKLKALYGGSDAEFEHFLEEYYFDLHYQPKPDTKPTNLGTGHLWRLAVDHPTQQVLPCVHRAPIENNEYRLLLIC